jgi:hypothetical protein
VKGEITVILNTSKRKEKEFHVKDWQKK